MIHKKTLKAGQVTKIDQVGQFVKVMNCENRFTIKATRQGREVVFSEAAAGFDLAAVESFDELTIQSETEQKLEIWVSQHKLSYDALSTKTSRANSFLVNHFGESQVVTPYDPSQSKVKIMSASDWWAGGEGVTNENGIPVLGGEIYTHDSAAPLSVYINEPKERVLLISDTEPSPTSAGYSPSEITDMQNGYVYLRGAKSGFLSLANGQFNEVIDSGTSGNFNHHPIPHDGKMFVDVSPSGGEIHLVEVNEFGEYLGSPVVYVVGDGFAARCGCSDGVALYFSGINNSGFDRAKVYRVKNSEQVISYDTNINPEQTDFTMGSIMYVGGKFYLSAFSSLYECSSSFNDCVEIYTDANLKPFRSDVVLSNAGFNVFRKTVNGKQGILALDSANQKVNFPSVERAAFFDSNSIFYVDDVGVKYSGDNGASFYTGYAFADYNISLGSIVSFAPWGEFVYLVLNDSNTGQMYLVRFESGVDNSTPKATFRVLKESY